MAEQVEVGAVALKLPQFWSSQPRVWFTQADAQFATRNITADDTKYHYVVAALDQDTAARLLDLLEAPPAANKYNAIKARLLATYALSDYERAGQLLNMPELGDDKPSALMDKMLALLGQHEACFLFRRIFLNRLPEAIRSVLVHSGETDNRRLAAAADQLWEAHRGDTSSVAACPVTRPRRNTVATEGICFYHATYGAKARRCKEFCKFQPSTAAASSPSSGNASADRH